MKLTTKRTRRDGEVLPEHLPEVLSSPTRLYRTVRTLAGFATGEETSGLADMTNLSPRKAPFLAVRRARELWQSMGTGTSHGMAIMDDNLYFVRGTTLYGPGSNGYTTALGTVENSDKVMLAFNGELLIFPDRVYLDRDTHTLRPMELSTVACNGTRFRGNTITLGDKQTWSNLGFRVGDCLTCDSLDPLLALPEGDYQIIAAIGSVAMVNATFAQDITGNVKFYRRIPALSTLCVSGDRLYGTVGNEVYISAAGSAFDWYASHTDGKEACHLLAGSVGDFTACTPWQGYVVFFKENRICKLTGSRADTYALTDIPAPGIPAGVSKTLCEVGGALYYYSTAGVYRYTGSYPEAIGCPGIGTHLPGAYHPAHAKGVGGTDGLAYYIYLAPLSGAGRLFLYDPAGKRFYAEDDCAPVCMLTRRGCLVMQMGDGRIMVTASDGRSSGFLPGEMGNVIGTARFLAMRPDNGERWRPLSVIVRATGSPSGSLCVKAAFSDGAAGLDATAERAVMVGQVAGDIVDRRVTFPLNVAPCDGVVLFLEMSGSWEIGEVSLLAEVCR